MRSCLFVLRRRKKTKLCVVLVEGGLGQRGVESLNITKNICASCTPLKILSQCLEYFCIKYCIFFIIVLVAQGDVGLRGKSGPTGPQGDQGPKVGMKTPLSRPGLFLSNSFLLLRVKEEPLGAQGHQETKAQR